MIDRMSDKTTIEAQPVLDLSDALVPDDKELKRRQSVFWQFLKFNSFNLRIMKMVFKGHHPPK
ncbi:MAG: hypothetical protein CSA83_01215 [Actinomycetales bacterium]|nr:MAG: hypothetical protein CSA83_01215 [Actinomycetales bacterium]